MSVKEFKPRPLAYFSPSGWKMYNDDRIGWFKQYIGPKVDRSPQNHHMAVGSSFDAYAKAFLHKMFVNDGDEAYKFENLFPAQVEPHNRDKALVDGKIVYEAYTKSGALADLCKFLTGSIGKPRFESSLTGTVVGKQFGGIVLNGKPDLYFTTANNLRVILDWKVNGFYSSSGASPAQGFARIYPGLGAHDKCNLGYVKGFPVNQRKGLEIEQSEWCEQLTMYAWLLGTPIGEEFVMCIHQLVCRPNNIRTAMHSFIPPSDWQHELFEALHKAWYRVQQGIYFDETDTPEASYEMALSVLNGAVDPEFDKLFLDR